MCFLARGSSVAFFSPPTFRHQDYLRQEVLVAVSDVSSDSHAPQVAWHPGGHPAAQVWILHGYCQAWADASQQQRAEGPRGRERRYSLSGITPNPSRSVPVFPLSVSVSLCFQMMPSLKWTCEDDNKSDQRLCYCLFTVGKREGDGGAQG